tara:strand:+ start:103 stop:339 length:237 start_codon:yes stop_codon:yes gene_type:complete
MEIKKIELRSLQQVHTYELEDGDIIDNFGSIERFQKILDDSEQPTEEEDEMLSNILSECPVEVDNIWGGIEESFFEYE